MTDRISYRRLRSDMLLDVLQVDSDRAERIANLVRQRRRELSNRGDRLSLR